MSLVDDMNQSVLEKLEKLEKIRESQRRANKKYREANPEKFREYALKYYKKNPTKQKEYYLNRKRAKQELNNQYI